MVRALTVLLLTFTGLLAAEEPLIVISYNIRQDTADDTGPKDWSQRKGTLTGYLLKNRASIIGLQEVRHNQLLDVNSALPNHAYVGVGREDGKTAGEYSPVFYDRRIWRLDPEEQGTFWLSDTPAVPNSRSWGNRHTRICTWARLIGVDRSDKRKSIYVYNTHWDHQSQPSRVKSGALILETIRARTHQEDPFILMGDLNATTENPAVMQLLGSGLLSDHGEEQMRSSSQWRAELAPGLRIDHIFTSASIDEANVQVESNGDSANRAGSDHHPVRLSIQEVDPPIDLSEPAQVRSRRPVLIAHRGGVVTASAPECSIAAIQLAAKEGFSMVELDIQRSQDAVAIVFHDQSLRQACGMEGSVADYPAAQLSEFKYAGTDQKIISLDRALSLCVELGLGIMLDLKDGREDEQFLEQIEQLIVLHKLTRSVISISSTPQARERLKHVMFTPTAEQLALFRRGDKVDLRGTFWFGLPKALPTADVSRLQESGAYVFPAINTFRYPKERHREPARQDIERLRSAGVDGFQIDSVYTDLLKAE